MHRAALVAVEVTQRGSRREEVVDGGHGIAGVDEDGGRILRAGCVGVGVWDAERVAVGFDKVAALRVRLEVQLLDYMLCGAGLGLGARRVEGGLEGGNGGVDGGGCHCGRLLGFKGGEERAIGLVLEGNASSSLCSHAEESRRESNEQGS